MNQYVFVDQKVRYTRITKKQAEQLWNEGNPVVFCPVKLRPGFPFAPHMTLEKTVDRESFAGSVNSFEF